MFIDKFLPKDPTIKRHILKTITWRILGTIDTIILGWIITGDPFVGLEIGLFELITKMVLYFLHERIWYKIRFGIHKPSVQQRFD
jgi:uncharacterized membrane protein